MDTSAAGLIRNSIPNIPNLIKTTILALLGRSPNSEHQDVLTEFIVNAAKPILQTPAPLLKSQIHSCTDRGVGRPWVSKYAIPKPSEDGLFNGLEEEEKSSTMTMRSAVDFVIHALDRTGNHASNLAPIPDLIDVGAEWTFYRPDTYPFWIKNTRSEQQLYHDHMERCDPSGPTIIHLHGGAFCLMDPATHRSTASTIAQYSGGRVFNVRYRLSPQNVFPAALLDAFQAYLALLSPPPGSFHQPVPASQIVISGDSSGGCLAASLMLLLVTLAKHNISIQFNGENIPIPSPPCAGLTVVSPWLDVTRSLPSTVHNAKWDIIAPPPLDAASPPFPPDSIWPTSPPRAETYTTAYLVSHPLVSPVAAQKEDWIGVPPVYISCGWEGFTDECEILARRIYSSSPTAVVEFEGWQGMPHCFQVMPWNKAGRIARTNWGSFCSVAVAADKGGLITRSDTGTWTSSKTYKTIPVKFTDLGMLRDGSCGYVRDEGLDDETVDAKMEKGRMWRIGLEEVMVRNWKKGGETNL